MGRILQLRMRGVLYKGSFGAEPSDVTCSDRPGMSVAAVNKDAENSHILTCSISWNGETFKKISGSHC